MILKMVAPAVTALLCLSACAGAPATVVSSADKNITPQSIAPAPVGGDLSSRISSFWSWFKKNQKELSAMSGPEAPVFSQLTEQIKAVDTALAFEIGPGPTGKKEFAVSVNGNETAFPLVLKMVAAAPSIDGWQIVAFRQKTPPQLLKQLRISAQIAENGKVVPGSDKIGVAVEDMKYKIQPVDGKAKITVFIKNYQEDGPQSHMADMMLQQAVGEYDMVKKIKTVEYKSVDAAEAKDAKPFEQMGAELDKIVPGSAK